MESARVLIVEDDPNVRTALSRALSFEGYEIDTAGDGGRGQRCCAKWLKAGPRKIDGGTRRRRRRPRRA